MSERPRTHHVGHRPGTARRPLWLLQSKQDGGEHDQAERGRAGCSEAHRTLEAMEDLVLRWETTRRWRQKGPRS